MAAMADPVALLKDLLRFNTVNPPGDERTAQEHLAALLEGAGLEVELLGRTPERPKVDLRDASREVRCDYLLNEGAGPLLPYGDERLYGVCFAEKGVFRSSEVPLRDQFRARRCPVLAARPGLSWTPGLGHPRIAGLLGVREQQDIEVTRGRLCPRQPDAFGMQRSSRLRVWISDQPLDGLTASGADFPWRAAHAPMVGSGGRPCPPLQTR
jgi:hypothetical protein